MAGTALYGAMLVFGITTAIVMDHDLFGTKPNDPPFLSIQLADMLAFAVLGGEPSRCARVRTPTSAW